MGTIKLQILRWESEKEMCRVELEMGREKRGLRESEREGKCVYSPEDAVLLALQMEKGTQDRECR